MTEQPMNAAQIAGQLTAEKLIADNMSLSSTEWDLLHRVAGGDYVTEVEVEELEAKGLVYYDGTTKSKQIFRTTYRGSQMLKKYYESDSKDNTVLDATEVATMFQIGDTVRSQPPNRDAFEGIVKIVGDKGLIVKTPDGDRIAIMSETVKITASEQAAAAAGGEFALLDAVARHGDLMVSWLTKEAYKRDYEVLTLQGFTCHYNVAFFYRHDGYVYIQLSAKGWKRWHELQLRELEASLTAANEREKAFTERGGILEWVKEAVKIWASNGGLDPFSITMNVLSSKLDNYERTAAKQAVSAVSAGEGEGEA